MKRYVTKKENLCVFKTDKDKQGNSCFIRGKKYSENGKHPDSVLSILLEEFRGEFVRCDSINLYPVEN
jgi:hypothetical protein